MPTKKSTKGKATTKDKAIAKMLRETYDGYLVICYSAEGDKIHSGLMIEGAPMMLATCLNEQMSFKGSPLPDVIKAAIMQKTLSGLA